MSTSVVRTCGLTKDYGSGQGLFDLDLEVRPGEILGFLGPNGSGKSTTLRLLLDLIRPTSGSASLFDLDSRRDAQEIHRRVGFLPGDLRLYRRLTGRQMLAHLAALRPASEPGECTALADRFDAQLDRPMGQLSTGNRQKIGLIQAFMHRPELVILDEPIAGLDPLVQQSFHELLTETAREGRTILLSSHTLSEVERVADRVAILREGRLVVVETLEKLRATAVRRIDLEFVGLAPAAETVAAVDGVRSVAIVGHGGLSVRYEGSADPLLKFLATHEVQAIVTRDDDLEELFLQYYRGECV